MADDRPKDEVEQRPRDEVERFMTEQKSADGRKEALIDDLLRQREAAIKGFDERLAKLGYQANSGLMV